MELYLHIPFCVRKCRYCDFLSFPAEDAARNAYLRALRRDIRETSAVYGNETVTSIFFGGGTPSVLPADALPELLAELRSGFSLREDCEITVECNPGTLSEEKLRAYREAGVNRLSMGVQSSHDAELRRLGRIHTWREAVEAFGMARSAGFRNLSVDVMMSLPGQTLSDYEETLQKVIALSPEHISAYDLIIEEGTGFGKWYEEEPGAFPDEDVSCRMYRRTVELLSEAGYRQYEISNYARPGFESRHNYGYWSNEAYLGLGLGASSYVPPRRFRNTSDWKQYLQANQIEEETVLTGREQQEEFFFLGLRRTAGISREAFAARFPEADFAPYEQVLLRYAEKGLVTRKNGRYALTVDGMLLSNRIFTELGLAGESESSL